LGKLPPGEIRSPPKKTPWINSACSTCSSEVRSLSDMANFPYQQQRSIVVYMSVCLSVCLSAAGDCGSPRGAGEDSTAEYCSVHVCLSVCLSAAGDSGSARGAGEDRQSHRRLHLSTVQSALRRRVPTGTTPLFTHCTRRVPLSGLR